MSPKHLGYGNTLSLSTSRLCGRKKCVATISLTIVTYDRRSCRRHFANAEVQCELIRTERWSFAPQSIPRGVNSTTFIEIPQRIVVTKLIAQSVNFRRNVSCKIWIQQFPTLCIFNHRSHRDAIMARRVTSRPYIFPKFTGGV